MKLAARGMTTVGAGPDAAGAGAGEREHATRVEAREGKQRRSRRRRDGHSPDWPLSGERVADHPRATDGRHVPAQSGASRGIPKPDGGERELGIPTVLDRLIQQALLQVLQPLIDPTFSDTAMDSDRADARMMRCLQRSGTYRTGQRIVVDVDLEKFFDRVNHDVLMDRLKKRMTTPEYIRLIRAYLNAGIMTTEWCSRARRGNAARRAPVAAAGQRAARRSGQGAGSDEDIALSAMPTTAMSMCAVERRASG